MGNTRPYAINDVAGALRGREAGRMADMMVAQNTLSLDQASSETSGADISPALRRSDPVIAALYVLLSLGLWVVVEYVTVWHSRLGEWLTLMPWAILQYLFIVSIFWYLLFRRRWDEKKVFVAMVVVMFVFEVLWQNYLLANPVTFVPVFLLLVSIWGFLTFIPLWTLEGRLRERKWSVLGFTVWAPVGLLLAIAFGV